MILKVLFSFKLSTNWPYVSSSNWKLQERNYERLSKVHVCPRLSLCMCCPGGKPVASHGILFLATQEIQKAVGWLFAFFFFFHFVKSKQPCAPYDNKFSGFTFTVSKYAQDATWRNGATWLNAGWAGLLLKHFCDAWLMLCVYIQASFQTHLRALVEGCLGPSLLLFSGTINHVLASGRGSLHRICPCI